MRFLLNHMKRETLASHKSYWKWCVLHRNLNACIKCVSSCIKCVNQQHTECRKLHLANCTKEEKKPAIENPRRAHFFCAVRLIFSVATIQCVQQVKWCDHYWTNESVQNSAYIALVIYMRQMWHMIRPRERDSQVFLWRATCWISEFKCFNHTWHIARFGGRAEKCTEFRGF